MGLRFEMAKHPGDYSPFALNVPSRGDVWYACANPTSGVQLACRPTEDPQIAVRAEEAEQEAMLLRGEAVVKCDKGQPLNPNTVVDGVLVHAKPLLKCLPKNAVFGNGDVIRFTVWQGHVANVSMAAESDLDADTRECLVAKFNNFYIPSAARHYDTDSIRFPLIALQAAARSK